LLAIEETSEELKYAKHRATKAGRIIFANYETPIHFHHHPSLASIPGETSERGSSEREGGCEVISTEVGTLVITQRPGISNNSFPTKEIAGRGKKFENVEKNTADNFDPLSAMILSSDPRSCQQFF
jgi:hypothetical protein